MPTTTKKPVKKLPRAKKVEEPKVEKVRLTGRIATVPDKSFYERYENRKLTSSQTDFDVFDEAFAHHENVLIEGPTGTGKTSAVLAYCAKSGLPFYAIPSNVGIEPSQLFGKYIPDAHGGFVWQDGPVTDIIRNGGGLLINEINFMPERVSTVLFGVFDVRREICLLDHKAEVIRAHPQTIFFADMNPEYEGTRPLNKALRNRFEHQHEFDYDEEIEAKLIKSKALLDLSKQIREQGRLGTIETPLSTNMLVEFQRIGARMGVEYAALNFTNHFHAVERESIRTFLEAAKAEIEDDFKTPEQVEAEESARKASQDDDDAVAPEATFDWLYDEDDDKNGGN